MKKILILTLFIGMVSFSKDNKVDLKIGSSFNYSRYKEDAKYYNHAQPTNHSQQPLIKEYENKNSFSFDISLKALKSENISEKKGLELKYGGGISFDIVKRSKLNQGFKNVESNKNNNPNFPTLQQENEFKDTCDDVKNKKRCLLHDYLEDLVNDNTEESDSDKYYREESKAGTKKMFEISKDKLRAYLSLFGSVEVAKKIQKDLKIYTGVDAGISFLLANQENVEFKFGSQQYYQAYKLERNQQRIAPKIKATLGINYKYFDLEIGVGYPNAISLGIGTRIGF